MPEEMPLYRSHKRVHALKIKGVFREGHGTEYSSTIGISFENARYEPLHGIETANRPFPAPGWYYVVYADGYHSFSPAKQFEEAHTLVPPDPDGSRWLVRELL